MEGDSNDGSELKNGISTEYEPGSIEEQISKIMESDGNDSSQVKNGISTEYGTGSIDQDEQTALLNSFYESSSAFTNEQINAQKQAIEDEIKKNSKLIGDLEDLSTVQKEFQKDPVYLAKVMNLASKYSNIRRTRPDGNCFFRAVAFAYFEKMSGDVEIFNRFYAAVLPSKDMMIAEGFASFAVEDFYECFMEQLAKIGPDSEDANSKGGNSNTIGNEESGSIDADIGKKILENLIKTFNDQGLSDYIVCFLRLLTSMNLKQNSEFYQSFMEGEMTIENFCKEEVEPMYRESDHIHIIAIAKQTGIKVRIQYLDRGSDNEATAHDFPEETECPDVHLLYRPGHYDILYLKNQ